LLYRKDQTEVCTLSNWVSPPQRPYPPYYRTAFAFSVISYPLFHPPSFNVGNLGLTQLSMKKNVAQFGWSLYPGGRLDVADPSRDESVLPTYHVGDGLSASLAISASRGFTLTLHFCSTLPAFPSPPPHRGWQRSEHCPQGFAPRITPQHAWVGTPGHHGARSGSLSPYSILLHRPYEVSQEYACSLPGRNPAKPGVLLS
jgi:hypothetical protein